MIFLIISSVFACFLLNLEGAFSAVQTTIDEKVNHTIMEAVGKIIRPQHEGILHLEQQVNDALNMTDYVFTKEDGQVVTVFTKFTTENQHLPVIIIPSTDVCGQLLPCLNSTSTFVVLRKAASSAKLNLYFVNIAFVRQQGRQTVLEWSTVSTTEVVASRKTKTETEICRGETCGIQEWIFGTCPLVEHVCKYSDPPTILSRPQRPVRKRRQSATPRRKPGALTTPMAKRLPNSFDLLASHGANNLSGDVYDNTLRKDRHLIEGNLFDPNERISELECIECSTIGDFYSDLEEDFSFALGFEKRVSGETFGVTSDFFKMTKMRQGMFQPFVGFGKCSLALMDDKPMSPEVDDIVDFYLSTLKAQCDGGAQAELRAWLSSKLKFLHIVPMTLSLQLVATALPKYAMLSSQEFDQLMSALLLAKYTDTYNQMRNQLKRMAKNETWTNPLGRQISQRQDFLTTMVLSTMQTAHEALPNHIIKVTRALIRILKDKFILGFLTRAAAVVNQGQSAQPSDAMMDNHRNNLDQIMALKEFLLHGQGPLISSGTDAVAAFNSFYNLNSKRIFALVDAYENRP